VGLARKCFIYHAQTWLLLNMPIKNVASDQGLLHLGAGYLCGCCCGVYPNVHYGREKMGSDFELNMFLTATS